MSKQLAASLSAAVFLSLTLACGNQELQFSAQDDDISSLKDDGSVRDDLSFGHPHKSALRSGPHASIQQGLTGALATNKLKYYGGKVIPNAKVYSINWGGAVSSTVTQKMPGFYQAVMNSVHVDWLSEYNTVGKNGQDGQPGSNQSIGRGSFGGQVTITPSVTGTTVTDAQIQSELSKQINSGVLPQPDDNTFFAINFPKGVTIKDGTDTSCVQFCAYHGTFMKGTQDVYYAVLPSSEAGTSCASGCGSNSNWIDNYTSSASHELVEAITDAEVGIGTTVGRPLAWYDTTDGEIGDICASQGDGTIVGSDGVTYTVQKEYDNATGGCIISKSSGGGGGTTNDFAIALSPSSGSVSAGGSTSFTVNTSVLSGTAQSISLSVSGLPSGVTGSFSPATVTEGGSSTLTLTASSSAAAGSATFTVKGSATSGTHTTSGTLSVTSASGGEPSLSNGVAITVSGGTNQQTFYRVDVPTGATNLVIQISGGSGDADLYTRFGSHPSLTAYDCRPYLNGNAESCNVPTPAAGTYYVMLNGYAAYSGVALKASWSTGTSGGGTGGGTGSGDPALSNGVPVSNLSGAAGSSKYYQITIPAGTTELVVTTTGSTSSSNDLDLYVKQGSHPTASSYACRSWNYGSNEQCTISNPAAGTWYVLIRGYTAYSGASVQADWN